MPIEILLAFFAASIAIELTPGPNMAYLAILSAQSGRIAGYAAVAGVALGLLIIGLLAAYGVAALIEANHLIYQALRWG
ncbi:MAG: LysE family transporter, partial [Alphaproteobacteria bacterium]|nr:LysE family transporter [Alphaproteobacteria bacterium]